MNIKLREIETLDHLLGEEIDLAMTDLRVSLLDGKLNEIIQKKEEGEVTRSFDWIIEERFINALEKTGIPVRVDSEERGIIELGGESRYVVILDPLDGSDMAAHGYPLCSIAASVVDLENMRAVSSRIGDFGTGSQYHANEYKCEHSSRVINPSQINEVKKSFIVSYGAKRERIAGISDLMPLIHDCYLYLNYGGPMDIAKIATGQVDIFIETAKGMMARDTLPGMHILEKAGGVVLSLDGVRIDCAQLVDGRRKFIAAGNETLAREALHRLHL